jgi:DNA-binding phage protein
MTKLTADQRDDVLDALLAAEEALDQTVKYLDRIMDSPDSNSVAHALRSVARRARGKTNVALEAFR